MVITLSLEDAYARFFQEDEINGLPGAFVAELLAVVAGPVCYFSWVCSAGNGQWPGGQMRLIFVWGHQKSPNYGLTVAQLYLSGNSNKNGIFS